MRRKLFTGTLLALALSISVRASECRALIVCGDAGCDKVAQRRFETWTERWQKLLTDVCHYKTENVRILRSPERNDKCGLAAEQLALSGGMATLDTVMSALRELAAKSTDEDQVLVVFIGHGYDSQDIGKVCLPGKDIGDVDAALALEKLKARQFICINTAPASATWAKSLARKGRLIITATSASGMRSETYFNEFLLRALQPGNVSMLDAFNTASQKTIRFYHNQFVEKESVTVHGKEYQELFATFYPDKKMIAGSAEPQAANNNIDDMTGWLGRRLLGEVAGLEDNADGQPSTIYEDSKAFAPLPTKPGGDGEFAKTVFLGKP